MKTGLVLGKFCPPHKGHIYLIERAKYHVDFLLVVVGTTREQRPFGYERVSWLKQLVPHNTQVLEIPDNNPEGLTEDKQEFWDIWKKNLLTHMPFKPAHLFASEDYGEKLSKEMGMKFTMVDKERSHVPISATEIRKDPRKHWDMIPEVVQKYYEVLLDN